MKLTEWAREQGVSYRTALNWFHAGTLPVPARQLPTGTILVESPANAGGTAVAYCRVSSAEQRAELERQAGRVAEECGTRGITLAATVTEIGSGLNGNRVKLAKLLSDATATRPRSWWSTGTGWPDSVSSTWKPRWPRPAAGSSCSTRTR